MDILATTSVVPAQRVQVNVDVVNLLSGDLGSFSLFPFPFSLASFLYYYYYYFFFIFFFFFRIGEPNFSLCSNRKTTRFSQ